MTKISALLLFCFIAVITAEVEIDEEEATLADEESIGRFVPSRQLYYSLFTRYNPTLRQPLLLENTGLLKIVDWQDHRRTVFLFHGSDGDENSHVNEITVPALLEAEDLNVIVVDWSAGATGFWPSTIKRKAYLASTTIVNFIHWLQSVTALDLSKSHIIGHGHGANLAGVVARSLNTRVLYLTALDPTSGGWSSSERVHAYDAEYVEVIHTTVYTSGFMIPIGQTDFYPNAGNNMPGCLLSINSCSHDKAVDYFAESVVSGGFTATKCTTYLSAVSGICISSNKLQMGGLVPKTGATGSYKMSTSRRSPYSKG